MKKRIGELNGKPIVIGSENEVTKNEVHYSIVDDIVVLKARKDDGKLHAITVDETADGPSNVSSVTSLEAEEGQIIPDEQVEEPAETSAKPSKILSE